MTPVALIPKPPARQEPIRFEASARMNGEVYINATHLVSGKGNAETFSRYKKHIICV